MSRQRVEQQQPDPFAEMLHTEFSDIDDLFDDEIEDLKTAHPVLAKNLESKAVSRPKSSSGKFSRSQNMLNPQQSNVFELGKVGDKAQFLSTLWTETLEFSKYEDDIFKLLHYLFEDTKLDVLSFATHGILLAKLLTRWVLETGGQTQSGSSASYEVTADEFLNLDNVEGENAQGRALKRVGFVNHYLSDFPQLKSIFKSQLNSIFGDISKTTSWLTFK